MAPPENTQLRRNQVRGGIALAVAVIATCSCLKVAKENQSSDRELARVEQEVSRLLGPQGQDRILSEDPQHLLSNLGLTMSGRPTIQGSEETQTLASKRFYSTSPLAKDFRVVYVFLTRNKGRASTYWFVGRGFSWSLVP